MSEPKIIYLGPACEAHIGDRRMNSQWKLVPVEPTETMVINGFESEPDECFTDEEVWEQYQEMSGCQQAAFRAKLCWAAMLASAPEPPPADAGEVARLTAERDALQQRLNAADQRIDELTAPRAPAAFPGYPSVDPDRKQPFTEQFIEDHLGKKPEIIKGMIEAIGGKFAIMIDPDNGHYGWTFQRHPDGMWVSGRKATEAEMHAARTHANNTKQQ